MQDIFQMLSECVSQVAERSNSFILCLSAFKHLKFKIRQPTISWDGKGINAMHSNSKQLWLNWQWSQITFLVTKKLWLQITTVSLAGGGLIRLIWDRNVEGGACCQFGRLWASAWLGWWLSAGRGSHYCRQPQPCPIVRPSSMGSCPPLGINLATPWHLLGHPLALTWASLDTSMGTPFKPPRPSLGSPLTPPWHNLCTQTTPAGITLTASTPSTVSTLRTNFELLVICIPFLCFSDAFFPQAQKFR